MNWQELLKEEHKVNRGMQLKDFDGQQFNFVVFDLEWDSDGKIWAAAFVDHNYNCKVLHLADYAQQSPSPRARLLSDINRTLAGYEAVVGWSIKGDESDNERLAKNFELLKLPGCVMEMDPQSKTQNNPKGTYRFAQGRTIDLINVFEKKIVQFSIFGNGYRNLKLETVSQFFFGEGKLGTGASMNEDGVDVETQKAYVFKDALLVRRLMEVGEKKKGKVKMDRGILNLMYAIMMKVEEARQHAEVPHKEFTFERIVDTNITTWWAQILDDYGGAAWAKSRGSRIGIAPLEWGIPVKYRVKYKNKGGGIIDPIPGMYEDVDVVDVQSLYPSMVIKYNLSFDTVSSRTFIFNPSTGKTEEMVLGCGRPECELDGHHIPEMIEEIGDTWFCNPDAHKRGIFSQRNINYKKERVRFKELGDTVMATGLKILLNGGYGGFANEFWKYRDMRVAEGTTAFGRHTTLKQLKPKAEELGFLVIYGDTDSLFLKFRRGSNMGDEEYRTARMSAVKALIDWTKTELDIVLEHEKMFEWVEIIMAKHYIGRLEGGDLIIKGMEGKKGDRCKWVRDTFDAMVKAIDKKQDPVKIYKDAVLALMDDKVKHEDLKLWIRLNSDPADYTSNCQSKQVGEMHGAKEGDLVWYFKAHSGVTLNYARMDKNKYIDQLDSAVEKMVEYAGHSLHVKDGKKQEPLF
jgi:hypothetical protein